MPSEVTKLRKARYLTELLCKNSAKKHKVALPAKFWHLPEWEKYYKLQIVFVNRYLNEYDFDVLVTFIRQRRIYSLTPKWIVEAISKFKPPKSEIIKVDVDIIYGSLGDTNKEKDLSYLD